MPDMPPSISSALIEERDAWIEPLGMMGILALPRTVRGIVLFAHGSGSSRFSPRNTFVARELNRAGFATLLFDLLTPREEQDRQNVFDTTLLADRLSAAVEWSRSTKSIASLNIGFFGASTGAAAALLSASRDASPVRAIVSRGGRPDLAGDALATVRCPTLLIVGGNDVEVLRLNRQALRRLRCPKELSIVPGASHLFPERGALDEVVSLARTWFQRHLAAAPVLAD